METTRFAYWHTITIFYLITTNHGVEASLFRPSSKWKETWTYNTG